MNVDTSMFTIEGELSIYRAAELAQALADWQSQTAAQSTPLTLDLSEVTEMDCAGLQLLLSLLRSTQQAGQVLEIAAASDAVTEVLGLAGAAPYFAFKPSLEGKSTL